MNAATVGTEMPGPGGRLAQERNRRGWTVADTAEKLHLEPRAVEAIEADQFGKLGPQVFAKGHLKQYAVLLGLPVDELLEAYERVMRSSAPGVPQPAGEAPRTALPMSSRVRKAAADDAAQTPFPSMAPMSMWASRWARLPRWALPTILGALVALIVAGVLLWLKPWRPAQTEVAANSQGAALAASLEQPPEAVAPIADQPGGSTGATPPPGAASVLPPPVAAPPAPVPPAAHRVRLRLSFTSESWVEVRDASGAMLFRGKGAANSVKVVSGAAPLQVYLGAASGVQLEINRQAVVIGPQFVHGEVARFEAGADGVLRRGPRS